jgi:hypothetical protein
MHAPVDGADYACGFAVTKVPWAAGHLLGHHGQSAGWHALALASPSDRYAVLTVCNQGGDAGKAACEAAAAALGGRRAGR